MAETGTSTTYAVWKIALAVQGHIDASGRGLIDPEHDAPAQQCLDHASSLLGARDHRFAQYLLHRAASLKAQKARQHLFPSDILGRSFLKTRFQLARSNAQAYREDSADYVVSNQSEHPRGIDGFVADLGAHLLKLKDRFGEEASEEDRRALGEFTLYVLSFIYSEHREEVLKQRKEARPFDVGARAVVNLQQRLVDPQTEGSATRKAIVLAYAKSVLNRLERTERLGCEKSVRTFCKYLRSLGDNGMVSQLSRPAPELNLASSTVDEFILQILASHPPEPDLAGHFLGSLSSVAMETIGQERELLRLGELTNRFIDQEFQVTKEHGNMEPVKNRIATKQIYGSYRKARNEISGSLPVCGRVQHYLSWYTVPRVTEAFLMTEADEVIVEGVVPVGADEDPWDPKWSALKSEYQLAKIRNEFYEPPLFAALPSAYTWLCWEIAGLGVAPEGIKVEPNRADMAELTLRFEWVPQGGKAPPKTGSVTYHQGPLQIPFQHELKLPPHTEPIFVIAEANPLPSAVMFIGKSLGKELVHYDRFGLGNHLTLYLSKKAIADIRPASAAPPRAKKVSTGRASAGTKQDGLAQARRREAGALLRLNAQTQAVRKQSLHGTLEALERLARGDELSGRMRRGFCRLHRHLLPRLERGFSNAMEAEFYMKLARLSKKVDAPNEPPSQTDES